ncbi:Heat shock factor-binding protein 1 [Varanus komodoensis]|nr:Heat shock factor-binding protein 1 [Varanus komodoensis]
MAETDPKTVQDLTAVVQTLLQQMQDKFQTMSDQIIGRNILWVLFPVGGENIRWRLAFGRLPGESVGLPLCGFVFFNLDSLDDMSCRIDDLEKNIADLMTQAGVEELEGENKAAATKTSSENCFARIQGLQTQAGWNVS